MTGKKFLAHVGVATALAAAGLVGIHFMNDVQRKASSKVVIEHAETAKPRKTCAERCYCDAGE